MVMKMLTGKNGCTQKEHQQRDRKYKKTEATELKNTTELKNALEWFNNRTYEAEEQIIGLEDKGVELTHTEHQKEKRILIHEASLREPQDNSKWKDSCLIGMPGED